MLYLIVGEENYTPNCLAHQSDECNAYGPSPPCSHSGGGGRGSIRKDSTK